MDDFPPGVSWDEISHGYNAYSILKTGKDEWGQFMPLSNFRAYGDYPLALNLYLTIPFIAALGLDVFSIRLPHVLLGTLTILSSYFLAYGVTKSRKISLLTAFLVAIEPWNWFLSRFVAQSNISVFLLTSAFAAFFNRERSRYLLPLSAIFLGLSLYSYHTTRIVAPLILGALIFVYKKDLVNILKKGGWSRKLTFIFLLVLFVPLPFILINPESRARSGEVFLIDQGVVNRIIEKRQTSNLPDIVDRAIYNRPLYFVTTVFKNHLGYYSPDFLFFRGGTHYQFSMPGRGLLFPVNLPFFYLGLFLAANFAFRKNKKYSFILLWFLIAPVSGSITKEAFAVMRATPMIPLVQLFTASGFVFALELAKRGFKKLKITETLLWGLYIILLFGSLAYYLSHYLTEYAEEYSQDRQYGHKEAVSFIKDRYESYDKIIVTKKYGEPHEFILFFWPWDPESYRNDPNLVRYHQSDWYWVDAFDKFYFINDWQIDEEGTGNYTFNLESKNSVHCTPRMYDCLLVTSPGNTPQGWNKLETIKFLNGESAFEVFEN